MNTVSNNAHCSQPGVAQALRIEACGRLARRMGGIRPWLRWAGAGCCSWRRTHAVGVAARLAPGFAALNRPAPARLPRPNDPLRQAPLRIRGAAASRRRSQGDLVPTRAAAQARVSTARSPSAAPAVADATDPPPIPGSAPGVNRSRPIKAQRLGSVTCANGFVLLARDAAARKAPATMLKAGTCGAWPPRCAAADRSDRHGKDILVGGTGFEPVTPAV